MINLNEEQYNEILTILEEEIKSWAKDCPPLEPTPSFIESLWSILNTPILELF